MWQSIGPPLLQEKEQASTQLSIGWCSPGGGVVGTPLTLSPPPPPTPLWEGTRVPSPREPTSGRPQLSPHGLPAAHSHQVAAAGALGWRRRRPVGVVGGKPAQI